MAKTSALSTPTPGVTATRNYNPRTDRWWINTGIKRWTKLCAAEQFGTRVEFTIYNGPPDDLREALRPKLINSTSLELQRGNIFVKYIKHRKTTKVKWPREITRDFYPRLLKVGDIYAVVVRVTTPPAWFTWFYRWHRKNLKDRNGVWEEINGHSEEIESWIKDRENKHTLYTLSK